MPAWMMLEATRFGCNADLVCVDVNGLLTVLFATAGAILIWPPLVERLRSKPRR